MGSKSPEARTETVERLFRDYDPRFLARPIPQRHHNSGDLTQIRNGREDIARLLNQSRPEGNERTRFRELARREIASFLSLQNMGNDPGLTFEDIDSLAIYNRQSCEFFRTLYQNGLLNSEQRRILNRSGVPPEFVPPPLARGREYFENLAAYYANPRLEPEALDQLTLNYHEIYIPGDRLKRAKTAYRETTKTLFNDPDLPTVLEQWLGLIDKHFPSGELPRISNASDQDEHRTVMQLLNALETKRLGTGGKLSKTERVLANSACETIGRSKFYRKMLNEIASATPKERAERNRGLVTEMEATALLLLMLATLLQGWDNPKTFSGQLILAANNFLQNPASLIVNVQALATKNNLTFQEAIREAPQNFRQIVNVATNLILDEVTPVKDKQPYPYPLPSTSITEGKRATAVVETKIVGDPITVTGPDGKKLIGHIVVPKDTPETVECGDDTCVFDPNHVSGRDGSLVWRNSRTGRYFAMVGGQAQELEAESKQFFSLEYYSDIVNKFRKLAWGGKNWNLDLNRFNNPESRSLVGPAWTDGNNFLIVVGQEVRVLSEQQLQEFMAASRVQQNAATPTTPPANTEGAPASGARTYRIPAGISGLADVVAATADLIEETGIVQFPNLHGMEIAIAGVPSYELRFAPFPGNSANLLVYDLTTKDQLVPVAFVDTINKIVIKKADQVPIPGKPGQFYWEGSNQSKQIEKDAGTPLFLPVTGMEAPEAPATILVQEPDESGYSLLATPDKNQPGYYRVQGDGNGRTEFVETTRTQPTPAEAEALGRETDLLLHAGATGAATALDRAFTEKHTQKTKIGWADHYYRPDGTYAGFGTDSTGKGPTHLVDYHPGEVIGEPGYTNIHVHQPIIIPGTTLTVTTRTHRVLDQPIRLPGDNGVTPTYESSPPISAVLDNGVIVTLVPGSNGLYESPDGSVSIRITGTGDAVKASLNTNAH